MWSKGVLVASERHSCPSGSCVGFRSSGPASGHTLSAPGSSPPSAALRGWPRKSHTSIQFIPEYFTFLVPQTLTSRFFLALPAPGPLPHTTCLAVPGRCYPFLRKAGERLWQCGVCATVRQWVFLNHCVVFQLRMSLDRFSTTSHRLLGMMRNARRSHSGASEDSLSPALWLVWFSGVSSMPRPDMDSWKRQDEQSGLTVQNYGGGRHKPCPPPLGPAQPTCLGRRGTSCWGRQGPGVLHKVLAGWRCREPPRPGFLLPAPPAHSHDGVPGTCSCQPENPYRSCTGGLRIKPGCPGPQPAREPKGAAAPAGNAGPARQALPCPAPVPAHVLSQVLLAPQPATS